MSKKNAIENKSTKQFLDLACRSFDANWKAIQEVVSCLMILIL